MLGNILSIAVILVCLINIPILPLLYRTKEADKLLLVTSLYAFMTSSMVTSIDRWGHPVEWFGRPLLLTGALCILVYIILEFRNRI